MPDPVLTPGLVRPLSRTQICATAWGRDRRHVTARMRRTVAQAYGLTVQAMSACCELDHLIPRSMGGADDPRNLWPQPWPDARQKDRLEVYMDKAVCAGRVSLREAQEMFRTDWRGGYDRHMLTRPR
jgi:hypothetical protein